jgi:hypothetical protein
VWKQDYGVNASNTYGMLTLDQIVKHTIIEFKVYG